MTRNISAGRCQRTRSKRKSRAYLADNGDAEVSDEPGQVLRDCGHGRRRERSGERRGVESRALAGLLSHPA